MNREKLNKAAKQDAINTVIGDLYERGNYEMGFVEGAYWLMEQPLSERLTDEEKEKIKAISKKAKDSYEANNTLNTPQTLTEAHSRGYDVGIMAAIEDIFGADLFGEE